MALTGCFAFEGLAYEKNLTGRYALWAVDTRETMSLVRTEPPGKTGRCAIDRVSATVFGVGWSDSFIIAKQHPREFPNEPDRSITNWYIVRTADDTVFGPFDEETFAVKRDELGVPGDLEFTLVFDDLK